MGRSWLGLYIFKELDVVAGGSRPGLMKISRNFVEDGDDAAGLELILQINQKRLGYQRNLIGRHTLPMAG